jgi:hypothetical protein
MLKSIRRFVCGAVLLAVFSIIAPTAVVRADDPEDYNAYWQRQAEITAELERGQTPYQGNTQDYNAYWQRQAEIAAAKDRMPAPPPPA